MNPFRATEARESEFARFIGKYLELTELEINDLEYRITYSEYYILKRKNSKGESNFLFRISFPFWFLVMLLLFTIAPFKWIFTGDWYYQPKGVVYKFMNNWQTKLFQ